MRNYVSESSSSSTAPYEYLYLAQSGDKKSITKAASVDQYVKMMIPQHHQEQLLKNLENLSNLDNEQQTTTVLRSYNPNRKLRRMRDNFGVK